METIQIEDLKCEIYRTPGTSKTAYIIYPMIESLSGSLIKRLTSQYDISVAVVYVPADEWNNYLTPWPEPPEEKNFPPFGGKAPEFLKILRDEIIPKVDSATGAKSASDRYLVGVSLSGLFALWEWLQYDLFASIACLSGSFWYTGFLEWFEAEPIPSKTGKAYFLLGEEEPHSKVKAYRPVGVNTEAVVSRLKEAGVSVTFDWVPGNHFSDPVTRLEKAFAALYSS